MVLMSSTTVADAGGGLRQFADPVIGGAGLIDGLVGHPRRFLHLAADLGDRRGHLLGRGGHRLHIGGGFLGSRSDHRGQFLGALGGRRQRAGGGFELARCRRHGLHDIADRTFEIVGELDHFLLAPLRRDLVLLDLGLGLLARLLLGVLANDGHGLGEVADFVAAAGAGNLDVEIAAGHLAQRAVQARHRAGDAEEGKHHRGDQRHDDDERP